MTVLDHLKALSPSIIRTVSPMLIGWLVTAAAAAGLAWEPTPTQQGFVTALVGALWYAAIRWLEEGGHRWVGWLLGLPGAPIYDDPEPEPGDDPALGERILLDEDEVTRGINHGPLHGMVQGEPFDPDHRPNFGN